MTNPAISVVIPAYNCAGYIAETLESVFDQDHEDLEIIVVDDGSTDGTSTVLAGYADRIRIERQENQGVSAARNRAIELARGDWIAFLDADDIWHPEKLDTQLEVARLFPEAGLVFTDFRMVDDRNGCLTIHGARAYYGVFDRHGLSWKDIFDQHGYLGSGVPVFWGACFDSLFLGNFIKTSTVLVRRMALIQAGHFNRTLSTEEDYDLWLRLGLAGIPMACVDRSLVDARRRPGQLTSPDNAARVAENVAVVISAMADDATLRLGDTVVNKRLADIYRHLARVRLLSGEHGSARRAARESLRYSSFRPDLLGMVAWSYLPGMLTRGLARGVRAARRAAVPARTE